MHPEIRNTGPGSCPKCGMALEPVQASAVQDDGEYRGMRFRFNVSLAFAVPVVLLAMAVMLPGRPLHGVLSPATVNWIQFLLASPVVLWGGWPFFKLGALSVRQRRLNMFTLIAIGIGTAFGYSAAAVLFPGFFPERLQAHGGAPVYFEAAASITVLVLLGQMLELKARTQTGDAIRSLLRLAPQTARRIESDGSESDIASDAVRVGDRLRVRPGEAVPADGTVLEGTGPMDESMVTGESLPVDKVPGARVTGGTVNGSGSLIILADRVGSDTLLSKIVRMVGEAQRSRAPIQRLADRVSAVFVPAVIAVAAVTAAVWAWIGPEPRAVYALLNAVAVLMIACPCALGLATPMSIMVGIGRGALEGILIRDAEAIETLRKVDTLILDKTGTLTEGRPQVTSVLTAAGGGVDEAELLRLAGSLERGSEHPLAKAIVREAEKAGARLAAAEKFESIAGKGVTATIEGRRVAVGTREWFREQGIEPAVIDPRVEALKNTGETVMEIAVDGRCAGWIAVADTVKATAAESVRVLRRDGLRLIMVTGDNLATATAIAQKLGIDEVQAGVLPDGKGRIVKELQDAGRIVAMAGDGVNDAPALAQAHVGIAMGNGADIAMESAGVTLIKGDLRGIIKSRALSRAVIRNIRQNLFFAFVYNLLGVPVAAGVLYPYFGILLSPVIAGAAMSLSSVSVILNALRLKRYSPFPDRGRV